MVLTLDPGGLLTLGDGPVPGLLQTGVEAQAALIEALDRHLIRGVATDYGIPVVWSYLEVISGGLRFIGEWPPPGREHHEGPWTTGQWGTIVVPILERIRDGGYPEGFLPGLHSGSTPEEHRERLVIRELATTGYIQGQGLDGLGQDGLRLRQPGREALDPTPRDELDEARQRLRTSTTDAVIYAVEVAMGDRLRAIAAGNNIPTQGALLTALNDQLSARNGPQPYGKPWADIIRAVLSARNEYGHGRGDTHQQTLATWVLDSVEVILANI